MTSPQIRGQVREVAMEDKSLQTSQGALDLDKPRFLTADDAQSLASHPQYSAWVSASAGTGKTKVLTDRVLRLLLPRDNGQRGSLARSIVCMTFT